MIRRDPPENAGFLKQILSLADRVLLNRARMCLFAARVESLKLMKIVFRRSLNFMNLPVKTRNGVRSFSVRWNSHADLGVFYQVFINRDYDLSRFALGKRIEELYESMISAKHQPLIVDAGANIGASVVWFASWFPQSKIIAIEPAPDNCALLRRNCIGIDYELFAGGISSEDGTMYLQDPGCGHWAYRVTEEGKREVPVFAASKIVDLQISRSTTPFICKIDIEGGEKYLFQKNTDWIDKFPLLIVELHDYMLPGGSRSKGFLTTLSRYDFDFVPYGENIFCFNNRILR